MHCVHIGKTTHIAHIENSFKKFRKTSVHFSKFVQFDK